MIRIPYKAIVDWKGLVDVVMIRTVQIDPTTVINYAV